VNTDLFRQVKSSVRTDLGLDNFVVLGYVGVLREWVDLKPVYQLLRESDIFRLLVVGQEGLFFFHMALANEFSVKDKVIFTGNIPYNKVPEYIAAMDFCLIPFKNNDISQNSAPLKLFEYMACGKPVISSRLKGVQKIAGNRVFYADTRNDYYNILRKIDNSDPEILHQINDNRKYIENFYTWDKSAKTLEAVIKGVV
jgi:glycosyltransferase involved in cell wall biosynthesis